MGPLSSHILVGKNIDSNVFVSEFVNVTSTWDVGLLSQFFPKAVVDCILASLPPTEALGSDKIIWKLNNSGSFSIRSAYRSLEVVKISSDSNE